MQTSTSSETTTVWEFLFPEVKRETAKASENVREDLSSFLTNYSKNLDELYCAIDQNQCRKWSMFTSPCGLKYPFPTERTIDEFFEGNDDEVLYPIKVMTQFITYINDSYARSEKEFFQKIALFGETIEDIESPSEVLDNDCGIPTGDLEVMTADFLPVLKELADFLPELFSVAQKFLEFIFYLYSPENPLFNDYYQSTVLYTAFAALGKFLRLLYILENLVNSNDALSEGWEHFRRMTFVIKNEPGSYQASAEDMPTMEAAMAQIHRIVFSGSLYNLFMNSIAPFIAKPSAKHFGQCLEAYLDAEVTRFTKEHIENKFADREIELCDLTLLFQIMTVFNQQPRRKIIKSIWATLTTMPIVKLYSFVSFSPITYLDENCPTYVAQAFGSNASNEARAKIGEVITAIDQGMGATLTRTFSLFSTWQSNVTRNLQTGVNIGYFIKNFITRVIDLHFASSRPIGSGTVEYLGGIIEILKSVHMTLFINNSEISHANPIQVESIVKKLDVLLQQVAQDLRKKKYRPIRTKASLFIGLAYHCIRQFSGKFSMTCLQIISDLFASKSLEGLVFTHNDIYDLARTLEILSNYNYHIDKSCDVTFLFDSRDLFSQFLQSARKNPRRVLFLAAAINDIGSLFKDQPDLYQKLEKYFVDQLRENFISPTLSALETEVRFHAHQHLAVSERNPLKKSYSQFDKFLQTPPFKILGRLFDLQYETSYYFTRVFYNEITVAPSVWETYVEMANILERLYGVTVLDCHIPGAMMQQDIDVLEIMRNLGVFVSCYNYDLNGQVFVQRAEDSHYISVVGIPHIFASYRCHGIGIMNTTVDFTYRFLKSKFNIFSKFLFDDTIKSRLFNDIRWFEQHKEKINGMWPYERAEKFVTDMKRLAQQQNQPLSVLDHFRILITEIGNSLGFVRMVKNGGTRFLNNSIGFVYDEDTDLSFKEFADEVQLPVWTTEATERLDGIVIKLKDLFKNGENFFKMLVDVFSGPFRDKKNVHLTAFYAILPPLMLSYIDHIMVLKDKAVKQNKNASFSDDGFPMGVAYILKLLNQDAFFDQIHWFDSLNKHYIEEREGVIKTSNGSKSWGFFTGDNKQTVKLAVQMIERKMKEFQLIQTTVHSARILFN